VGRVIDVSLPLSPEMLVWPNEPGVELEPISMLERGDSANVSMLRLGTHTGTHVDPPVHFLVGGATIDHVSLDVLIGRAVVADMRGVTSIGPAELEAADIAEEERVLFLTDWSARWSYDPPPPFPEAYTALTPGGAAWMVDRGMRLVGTDFLSIELRGARDHPVHRTLLAAGVAIVEGLDLREALPGPYTLVCLPLKIAEGDGGPARAVLIED
jgi:arylformamidase